MLREARPIMFGKKRHFALGAAALILLISCLLLPGAGSARTKVIAFVDDDWDPVQRLRSYPEDPGYELYIQEALDISGIPYEIFEIQPDDGPPQVPPLEALSPYPLILWNCAAEEESTLTFTERNLIREYLEMGGKVMLHGQGVMNGLLRQTSHPDIPDFIENVLGVANFEIDVGLSGVEPNSDIPYLFDLSPVPLEFQDLPDPPPFFSDFIYPQPNSDSFLFGVPLPRQPWDPVAVDRFRPFPLHFQSFMVEAILDPFHRSEYLRVFMEYLGLEGDDIMDFMHGPDRLINEYYCLENPLRWSPNSRAMVFSSNGRETCSSVWYTPVTPPEAGACDWRIGFTLRIDELGYGSIMVPLELQGGGDRLVMEVVTVPGNPEQHQITVRVEDEGAPAWFFILDTVPLGEYNRIHVRQHWDPMRFEITVHDKYGNEIDSMQMPGFGLRFNQLRLFTVGLDNPQAAPMTGLIDDYFFEGCLDFHPTSTDEAAVPASPLALGAWPNPFNPATRIEFDLALAGPVELSVYDLAGRRQRLLFAGDREAGPFATTWNGRNDAGQRLSSGVYLLHLDSAQGSEQLKLLMLK